MARPNVFDGDFQLEREEMGIRGSMLGPGAGARELGASVYELDPGASGFNLHAHYGNEEFFVVLQGAPTLRTADSEEQLRPGDVVGCPRGREGMHTLANRGEEPALVLALSTTNSPDVVIYPDSDTVAVATRHPFASVPENGDEGIIALFSRADDKRPQR